MEHFSISSLLCEEDQSLSVAADDHDNQKDMEYEEEYIEILVSRESSLHTSVFCREDSTTLIIDNYSKKARSDSIRWIMKTRAYFGFSYETAYLSVTYYDRFSLRRTVDKGRSWMAKLLSVACLSLAAKMEECTVPQLIEYQSAERKFDSNTIQRMELLILSTLEWRLISATPFAYLGYFKSKLQIGDKSNEFVSKCIDLIFAIIHDINLVDQRSSTIAAAAVLAASNQMLSKPLVESKLNIISSCGNLQAEHVFSCYIMMVEESSRTSSSAVVDNTSFITTRSNKRRRLQLD